VSRTPYTGFLTELRKDWSRQGKRCVYCNVGGCVPSSHINRNMQKLLATLTVAVFALAPMAMAEEAAYVAGMTGVV